MYNRDAINRLVAYIQRFDGIGDKERKILNHMD